MSPGEPMSMDVDAKQGPASQQGSPGREQLPQLSATCSEVLPSSSDGGSGEQQRGCGGAQVHGPGLGAHAAVVAQLVQVAVGSPAGAQGQHANYGMPPPARQGDGSSDTEDADEIAMAEEQSGSDGQYSSGGPSSKRRQLQRSGTGASSEDWPASHHPRPQQRMQVQQPYRPEPADAAAVAAGGGSPAAGAGSSLLSSLEALVAACELAAEKEGLHQDEGRHYYQEVMAESPMLCKRGAGNLAPAAYAGAAQAPQHVLDRTPQPPTSPRAVKGHVHHPHEYDVSSSGLGPASRQPLQPMDAPLQSLGPSSHGVLGGVGAMVDLGLGHKYRRHKSKVFIRPNKVVYLPTTFMEEAFDPACLPINCEMVVEADGALVEGEAHQVTIKAVPRQGLSTMYCMTNVMKFQQQYLNWQILHWTKLDDHHIKIHLQGPHSAAQPALPRTSSAPTPRASHAARPTAGHAHASPATARAGGHDPHSGHEADGDLHAALVRSFSTSVAEPCSPSHLLPPNASLPQLLEGLLPEDPAGRLAGAEATRRSTRVVRMTALMAQHLQQERQQPVPGKLPLGQAFLDSVTLLPGGMEVDAVELPHKRRHELGRTSCPLVHPTHVPVGATTGLATASPMAPPLGPPYQHPVSHALVHGGSTCSAPLDPLSAASLRGAPLGMAPGELAHAASCPGAFMAGSTTANLYYLPQSHPSKRAAQRMGGEAVAAASAAQVCSHVPGQAEHALHAATAAAAAAGHGAGDVAVRPASGPRCIAGILSTPMAWERAELGPECPLPRCPVLGFPHAVPAAMPMLDARGTANSVPDSCITLPAPAPLNTGMAFEVPPPRRPAPAAAAAAGTGLQPACCTVSMLGPSLASSQHGCFPGMAPAVLPCPPPARPAAMHTPAAAAPAGGQHETSGAKLAKTGSRAVVQAAGAYTSSSSGSGSEPDDARTAATMGMGLLELDAEDAPPDASAAAHASAGSTGSGAQDAAAGAQDSGVVRAAANLGVPRDATSSPGCGASCKRPKLEPPGLTHASPAATAMASPATGMPCPAMGAALGVLASPASGHTVPGPTAAMAQPMPALGVPSPAYPLWMHALFVMSQAQQQWQQHLQPPPLPFMGAGPAHAATAAAAAVAHGLSAAQPWAALPMQYPTAHAAAPQQQGDGPVCGMAPSRCAM